MIQNKEGIISDHQRLIFAGKQILIDRTLADYKIRQDSVLYVLSRLKGGSLLIPVSVEERDSVSLMMSEEKGKIVFESKVTVLVEHFLSLQPKGKLVDNILNSYVAMTKKVAMRSTKLLNSFFYTKLENQVTHIIYCCMFLLTLEIGLWQLPKMV